MNKRDMAIAEAVRDAVCNTISAFLPDNKKRVVDNFGRELNIASVIASVPVDDEPYCWMVTNSSVPFYGEFAQIDAEREAKYCGGTAKAFPLYTATPDAAS